MHKNFLTVTKYLLVVTASIFILRFLSLPLIPLIEPSEARYSAISALMAYGKNGFSPWIWIDGCLIPFLGKPPMFFWTQSLSIQLLGLNELAARLPCLLFAGLTVLTMFMLLRRTLQASVAAFATVITASCGVFLYMAGSVAVDMPLVFGVTLAYCAYFNWLQSDTRKDCYKYSVLTFLGVAIAFLSKGLLPIILIGMPVFVWHVIYGGWKKVFLRHAWLTGIALLVILCGSWLYLMHLEVQQFDPPGNFFHHFFVEEHFNRFLFSDYSDPYGTGKVQPRFMAVLFMLLSTLPWVLIPFYWILRCRKYKSCFTPTLSTSSELPQSFDSKIKQRVQSNSLWLNSQQAFFILVLLCGLLFFSMARQILITYLLPLIPAFAIALAMKWHQCYAERGMIILSKIALGIVIICSIGMAGVAPFFSTLVTKMSVKDLILASQEELPDARMIVNIPGRCYSPYFYDFARVHHLNETYDSAMVIDNMGRKVYLPCLQHMPQRDLNRNMNPLRDLHLYYTKANPKDRIIMRCDDFPDETKIPDYFSLSIDSGNRLDIKASEPHQAQYHVLHKSEFYLILKPENK